MELPIVHPNASFRFAFEAIHRVHRLNTSLLHFPPLSLSSSIVKTPCNFSSPVDIPRALGYIVVCARVGPARQ
ncbi:MAG: hypothetical protein RML93_05095, partial [Anaerolineales bacterium]|nr:hypothetical protein [Anaerolineales bacterium]MDW8446655.1 hypothetical protein [Anaerolineales bacterium]